MKCSWNRSQSVHPAYCQVICAVIPAVHADTQILTTAAAAAAAAAVFAPAAVPAVAVPYLAAPAPGFGIVNWWDHVLTFVGVSPGTVEAVLDWLEQRLAAAGGAGGAALPKDAASFGSGT
jgi:hypothetical protein